MVHKIKRSELLQKVYAVELAEPANRVDKIHELFVGYPDVLRVMLYRESRITKLDPLGFSHTTTDPHSNQKVFDTIYQYAL